MRTQNRTFEWMAIAAPVFLTCFLTLPRLAMSQQDADTLQPVAATTGSTNTELSPLPGLPHPPEQPASLMQPAPTQSPYADAPLESPYFQRDPLVDLPTGPQPGWVFDVEVGVEDATVHEFLGQTDPAGQITVAVPGAGHTADVVAVPMAKLDWNVSPRFEAGYRLPSGFGEIDASYRFLLAQGNSTSAAGEAASPDAAAALSSHLNMHIADLDYATHESSLGPYLDMKWRIGLRYSDVYFDSQTDEPIAAAAAGSGVFERSVSNNFWGIGPHVALELSSHRHASGVKWIGRLETAFLFGEVDQKFGETSTTTGANGYLGGETRLTNDQQVPMLGGFLGLDWQPKQYPKLDVLFGYTAEYWWNVGRLSDPDVYNGQSAGEVGTQGPVFRLEYNY